MTFQSNILQRWRIELARLEGAAPLPQSPGYWSHLLQVRVLRYLVCRCADKRRWNRHAERAVHSSAQLPCDKPAQNFFRPAIPADSENPPKDSRTIRRALKQISGENVHSYREFGISRKVSETT